MEQSEGSKNANSFIANKKSPLQKVGEFLREARQSRNLSVEDLSSSFNSDSIYLASWFMKIESSNGIVSLFIFLKISSKIHSLKSALIKTINWYKKNNEI